ncbi:PfkB family carbohydrate kinase [Streptomyces antimycoticus]|uniref:PfkB family carbohydrate kinase n=1 Tax=Streptomyces antimycoticus TaxID=68175 RepID=UPI0036EA1D06
MTAPWPPAAGPVFCVGETMTDLAPAPPDSVETGESLRLSVADAESNVAMYLADLGLAAVWLSALGDDPFGRRVRTAVAAAGVDVSGVRSDPSRPTGLVDFLPLVNEGEPLGPLPRRSAREAHAAGTPALPGRNGAARSGVFCGNDRYGANAPTRP